MALNINDDEVERLAGEVSALSGESKTLAVKRALEARRATLTRPRDREAQIASFLRYLEEEIWPLIPETEAQRALTTSEREEILGYGSEEI